MTPVPALARLESSLARLGRVPREVAAIVYLGPEWRVLAMRHVMGGRGHVAVPIRTVVRDALGFGATAVLFAHGHPSGDARPSDADLAYTRILSRALDAVGVALHDHWVFAHAEVTSLRALGML